MIHFGIGDFQIKKPNWARHHKQLSLLVKRVYESGKEDTVTNDQLRKVVQHTKRQLKTEPVLIGHYSTDDRENAIDYYLPLENKDYEPANMEYYDVGASNASQTLHLRLKFMFESSVGYIDYTVKTGGSHAVSVADIIQNSDLVEDIIEDIVDKQTTKDESLEEHGIYVSEDDELIRFMVVNQTTYKSTTIELDDYEFKKGLIGVELYKFEYEIVNK